MTDDVACPKNGCAHKKSMYMYAQRRTPVLSFRGAFFN